MKKSNVKYLRILKVCMLSLTLTGCGYTATKQQSKVVTDSKNTLKYSDLNNAVTILSEDKKYKVTLYSNLSPLTTSKIHNWTVQVLTPDNKPVEGLKIYVHGGMPIHRHGFPTKPRVTKYLGEGRYLVNGVKFSMPGDWEMRFNIKEATKRDRVIFYISI